MGGAEAVVALGGSPDIDDGEQEDGDRREEQDGDVDRHPDGMPRDNGADGDQAANDADAAAGLHATAVFGASVAEITLGDVGVRGNCPPLPPMGVDQQARDAQ